MLDTTLGKQTQITYIRHEPSYKQLRVMYQKKNKQTNKQKNKKQTNKQTKKQKQKTNKQTNKTSRFLE